MINFEGSASMAVSTAGNIRIGLTVNKAVLPGDENDNYLNKRFAQHIQDQIVNVLEIQL